MAETVGAWYAFCPSCGGWIAWHAVFVDQDTPMFEPSKNRHVTPRVLESEFRCEHTALGRSVDFFRRDDNPGPCDCLEVDRGQ